MKRHTTFALALSLCAGTALAAPIVSVTPSGAEVSRSITGTGPYTITVEVDDDFGDNVFIGISAASGESIDSITIKNSGSASTIATLNMVTAEEVENLQKDGTSTGEVWIGTAIIGGTLGFDNAGTPSGVVSVDRISSLRVDGALYADIGVGGAASNPTAVNLIEARGGIFNNIAVVGDVNDIRAIDPVNGVMPIGTVGDPVVITVTDGQISSEVLAEEIFAAITVSGSSMNQGNVARIEARNGDFVGSLTCKTLNQFEVGGTLNADVTATSLTSHIAVWDGFSANKTIDLTNANGLPTGAEIMFNQHYSSLTNEGWQGSVVVGSHTITPASAADVEYTLTPAQLGGGTIGVGRQALSYGFAMHDEGNKPVNGGTYIEYQLDPECTEGDCCVHVPLTEVVLTFYGRVARDGGVDHLTVVDPFSASLDYKGFGSGTTTEYEITPGPGEHQMTVKLWDRVNSVYIPFQPGTYTITPGPDDIESELHPAFSGESSTLDGQEVRPFTYQFVVSGDDDCELFSPSRLDLHGDGRIDLADATAWMNAPVDINQDGVADESDFKVLMNAINRHN